MSKEGPIFPDREQFIERSQKEQLLKQKGLIIWLVGLSGSGKSTIATSLEERLHQEGFLTQVLDGDVLRNGLNKGLGFSKEDRFENLRRAAETAKILENLGVVTICSFITPRQEMRDMLKAVLQTSYYEVYVDCPIETCIKRDVKGLYKKALSGEISKFTGISAPFDVPLLPNLRLSTHQNSIEECTETLYKQIITKISL